MATGQSPKRRETDEQAAKRNADAKAAELEREEKASPIEILYKFMIPRINSSGKLQSR